MVTQVFNKLISEEQTDSQWLLWSSTVWPADPFLPSKKIFKEEKKKKKKERPEMPKGKQEKKIIL